MTPMAEGGFCCYTAIFGGFGVVLNPLPNTINLGS
jgi:hypothetical protein